MAEADVTAGVPGLGQVPVTAFRGDASWIGYPMVSGHWYTGPGQAVVPLGFLEATGTRIGGTITISYHGHQIPVHIVGDVFDPGNNGIAMLIGTLMSLLVVAAALGLVSTVVLQARSGCGTWGCSRRSG